MTEIPRLYHQSMAHYIRVEIDINSPAATKIGTIPAGSVILLNASGVVVTEAFDAGATNVIDIGSLANDDLFASDLAAGSVGFKALDENVAALVTTEDLTLTVTYAQTGTDATAGAATVFIMYLPNNG